MEDERICDVCRHDWDDCQCDDGPTEDYMGFGEDE